MTKQFCDLCGNPAVEQSPNFEVLRPFGPEREDEEYNKRRTQVRVHVNFGFRDHPTGFGGPPDLCPECVLSLAKELVQACEAK